MTSRSKQPRPLSEQLVPLREQLHLVYKEPVNMNAKASNAKGNRETQRAVLSLKESIALNKFVVKHYAESGLNNNAFAEALNGNPDERSKYRFDLNHSHIKSAIEAADIPNNRDVKNYTGDVALLMRVQHLEEQMVLVLRCLEIKP